MARGCSCCGTILGNSMSIKVTYRDGVFEPVDNVTGVRPGQICKCSLTRNWRRSARRSRR